MTSKKPQWTQTEIKLAKELHAKAKEAGRLPVPRTLAVMGSLSGGPVVSAKAAEVTWSDYLPEARQRLRTE